MKAIHIDFQAKPLLGSSKALMLLIVAILVLGATIFDYAALKAQTLDASEHLAQRQNTFQEKAKADARATTLGPEKIEAINKSIAQLNTPWEALFSALERNLSENVALLAITPNSSRREVKIFAEAKTSEDMTNFVETLAQDEFLADPLLIKHELEEKDANRPYRFVVETRWREQP